MRKLLLLVVVAVTLGATAAAAAKTVTVAITTTGYAPKSTTIVAGDSVQFFNNTTVVHQVILKTTTGVTCTQNPIALKPTQAATCKFASAGKYAYSDPSVAGNTFTGTVVVTSTPPATSVTLSASSQTLIYGGKVTLSGRVSTHKSGVKVDVLALVCGVSVETPVVGVTTTSGGAYTAEVVPQKNTIYTVQVKGTTITSGSVAVTVRPLVSLRRVAPHRYSVRVYAAQSFGGTSASFQRYRAAIDRWVGVRSVLLRPNTSGIAPTVISSSTFSSRIGAGLKVRIVLGAAKVGSCFLAGTSSTISS